MSVILFWIPLFVIAVVLAVYAFVMGVSVGFGKQKYDEEKLRGADAQTDYGRLIHIYEFLSRFPLTSKSTNQLHDIISGLSIYNDVEQRVETARVSGMSYLMSMAMLAVVFAVSHANLLFCVVAFVLIMAFRRDFVNKRLRKKRLRLWKDMLVTFTSLQQEYQRQKSLMGAFQLCQAEETTRYLLSNIEGVLKSEDPDGAMAYFCANNPFHICIRLAYLCYTTYKYNAVFVERDGADSFVTGLDTLLYDLQTEIDLAEKEKKKFYKVEKLPLIGLVLSFAGPWFMEQYFTGLRYYYNSGFGFISGVVALVVIVEAYIISTRLNDKDKSRQDVTVWEIKKFEDEAFRIKWENRVRGRMARFEQMIEKSLSYLTPAMIMFRKMLFGIAAFIVVLVLCAVYVIVERISLETNYKTIPESAIEMLQSNYKDYNFVIKKAYTEPNLNNEEAMYSYLIQQGWNLSDTEVRIMAKQLFENKAGLETFGFSPLYIFIALIAMLVGYNLPEIMLDRRAKLVRVEAKAEVLLLQSVVVQLMYTPMKLKDYLIFFASISQLYGSTHLLCYVRQFNFPEDLKKEAYKMFDPHYYMLMEQLYTLHSSMKAPQIFRETVSARRYLAVKFLEMREELLNINYMWLSMLLKAALFAPIILQIILPLWSFVSEALRQYSSMMPQ